jgi:hypothetical protein
MPRRSCRGYVRRLLAEFLLDSGRLLEMLGGDATELTRSIDLFSSALDGAGSSLLQ